MRIGMVHQHFMLIPVMTVAENVVLASEPRKGAMLDRDAAEARVRELSERFGLVVDPRALVEDIGVGQQQRVEILRVLHRGADVLILDEPTAVLTAQEIAELFKVLRALTAEGVSVIFISHKLQRGARDRRPRHRAAARQEDRHGQHRGRHRGEPRQADGRPRRALPASRRTRRRRGEPMLEVDATSRCDDDRGLPALRGLSLQVRAGEIVGVAGRRRQRPVRAGRGDHRAARPARPAAVRVGGTRHHRHAACAARWPPASATSPRTATGAASSSTSRWPRTSRCASTAARRSAASACSRPSAWSTQAEPLLEQYDVRGGEPETLACSLSGGNQQKCVIARELAEEPQVTIAAQPTRGLDVGAIEFVHKRLLEQRDAGRGVLLVSLELEEIRSLSDRVLVIYEGRIVAELSPDATDEELGVAMLGGQVPP